MNNEYERVLLESFLFSITHSNQHISWENKDELLDKYFKEQELFGKLVSFLADIKVDEDK